VESIPKINKCITSLIHSGFLMTNMSSQTVRNFADENKRCTMPHMKGTVPFLNDENDEFKKPWKYSFVVTHLQLMLVS
jgi:hypothetical protein